MIFRKFVGLVAAFAAIAAAGAICMVALAFAIYAGLRDIIGPAWAAAAVAGIVAFIALVIALVITRKARPKPAKGDTKNLTAQLIDLARERPAGRRGHGRRGRRGDGGLQEPPHPHRDHRRDLRTAPAAPEVAQP